MFVFIFFFSFLQSKYELRSSFLKEKTPCKCFIGLHTQTYWFKPQLVFLRYFLTKENIKLVAKIYVLSLKLALGSVLVLEILKNSILIPEIAIKFDFNS